MSFNAVLFPRQLAFLLRPALGEFARHRTVRHVPVKLLQHLHRRAHVAGQHEVLDPLLETERGVGQRVDRRPVPLRRKKNLLDRYGA